MAETHSPESANLNGGGGGGGGGPVTVTSSETVGAKRQRRPSVRLGEIGVHEGLLRRPPNIKQWKKEVNSSNKGSKTRALTNLTTAAAGTLGENNEVNFDTVAIGSWRSKDSKKQAVGALTKRIRSNWVSRIDDGGGGDNDIVDGDEKFSGGEYIDGNYREFEMGNSESPSRENSPIHSPENLGDGNERNEREMYYNNYNNNINRRKIRTRDHNNFHNEGIESSGPSDTEARGDYGNCGVRIWLNNLGLGRYAPVFEIHEVDDEVLPMLTLEDLKDMGINAVGSRRKMFCAIQKLGKGFS